MAKKSQYVVCEGTVVVAYKADKTRLGKTTLTRDFVAVKVKDVSPPSDEDGTWWMLLAAPADGRHIIAHRDDINVVEIEAEPQRPVEKGKCPKCNGTGKIDRPTWSMTCKNCKGVGKKVK